MGSAVSSEAAKAANAALPQVAWYDKPCEIVDEAGELVDREVFADAEVLFREKLQDLATTADRDAFGNSLLESLNVRVDVYDAGSWSRVVAREIPVASLALDDGASAPPLLPMALSRSLTRRAAGGLPKVAPPFRHSATSMNELLHDKLSQERLNRLVMGTRHFAVFIDGSDKAHISYLATKALVNHDRGDTLTVVTVESDKVYLKTQYKNSAIRARYEAELTAFVSEKRRAFITLPKQRNSVALEIGDFVNNRDLLKTSVRTHPDPSFLAIGFSGRKSRADRDPTVVGQTADLSLRLVFCPVILVKRPVRDVASRHYTMLVVCSAACVKALKIFASLMRDTDRLTLLYYLEGEDTQEVQRYFEVLKNHENHAFRRVANDSKTAADAIETDLNQNAHYADVDFVGVATRPSGSDMSFGSVSDHLVRHYAGNLVIIKAPEEDH